MQSGQAAPMHDEVAVEAANRRFYAALENSDYEQMCALWLPEEWVKCVHPGWEVLRGWKRVREGWEQIFTNSRGLRAVPEEIEIRIEGDFAWVSCAENLAVFLDSTHAPVLVRATATNLFYRVNEQWLMAHHHASPVPAASLVTESELIP